MIGAIVTCLFEGSPPCSWGSLLGEGPSSLKILILLLSKWNHCPNCSIPVVTLQSGLPIPPQVGLSLLGV